MRICLAAFSFWSLCAAAELRFVIHSDPKTFDPALLSDESSQTVAYLTGGVLIRVNRATQALEPELAESWKLLDGGKTIEFRLRQGLRFSEGSPFRAEDAAASLRRLFDPATHSPTGDSFRTGDTPPKVEIRGPFGLAIRFATAVAGVERLFDEAIIVKGKEVLGPFRVAEYKAGVHVLLTRNPYYWRVDSTGKRLPYLASIRLSIQQNRDLEMLRFERGEIDLVNRLDPDDFARLGSRAVDLGPSLDSEQLWFNQVPTAPLPEHKKAWFRSREFRRAISDAVHREDMCRVVYRGRAIPAVGPVSPANRFWFNPKVAVRASAAADALARGGFHMSGGVLRDRAGNAVEFSIVTNAGNKARERIAAMIQQDLAKIGIRVTVVTLDFASLIERIARNFQYEACLLGLVNVDLDPNAQMNVWLSSAGNHQWNPSQPKPATAWEAEIDRLMLAQAGAASAQARKKYFDRVQEIVAEELPFIYLVHRNALAAVSPALRNVRAAVLRPETYWNVERLWIQGR